MADSAKTLIRTTVRTFYEFRQILAIDALLTHSVLDASDLGTLLGCSSKDVRKFINPLRAARLVSVQTRIETKVGSSSTRGSSHDYYYVHYHNAIDAIKYKIMRVKRKVEQTYQVDTARKDLRCPQCKAEYEELEVMDNVREDGFHCHRCGHLLDQIEDAGQSTGNHEKIRALNTQLSKFETIIARIDTETVPENNFAEAWAKKKPVPRVAGHLAREVIAVDRLDRMGRGPEQVNAAALDIKITSGAEHDAEEEAKREARRAELARQNQLPVWHTSSAINASVADGEVANTGVNSGLKHEGDEDDKKPELVNDAAFQAYLEDMKREQEEERKKAEEEMEDDDEGDDGDDFEDVVPTSGRGTPVASQEMPTRNGNLRPSGLKREYESESAPSSDANTPALVADTPSPRDDMGRGDKKVKFEDAVTNGLLRAETSGRGVDDHDGEEDDEGDFEDAI